MNRMIKFRGKRIDIDEWVYGYLVKNNVEEFVIVTENPFGRYDIIIKTVGQYTGFKDKNNKEIYEGDIVDVLITGFEEYVRCEVFWDKDKGCWNLKDKWGDHYYDYYTGKTPFEAVEDIKVIGNIHDNFELMWE